MSHFYNFYIAPSTAFIPLIIGIRRQRRLCISYRFLLAFLVLSITSSILMRVFAYVFHDNSVILKLYTIGEFPLLAIFYYWQFDSLKMRRIIVTTIVLFAAISSILFGVSFKSVPFDDYSTSLESLLIIFLGISLIYKNGDLSATSKSWGYYPTNWFNTGILLYFSGSLFIFLLTNYILIDNNAVYLIMWDVNATLFVLLNLFLSIGFLKA